MITVDRVTKRFGDFVALDDVSLEVPDGSLTALLGPSGSGKSTLLRVIAGLEVPDTGEVIVAGARATHLPARKREIGFVFQHYAAFKHLTVFENVAFGLRIRKRPKEEIQDRVHELLALVGLDGYAKRYPSQLSGGQRQRMALARALAVQPRVLLLDEPFGALDANVRADLRAWLRRLHDQVHVTTVLVTHDQEEAMEVADNLAVLRDGRIEQTGAPREIYDAPANDFVMGFIGPVSRVSGRLVRPHDLLLAGEPHDGAQEAMVRRVLHLGFEVRVELVLHSGEELTAQVTRGEAEELELSEGDIVWVRPPSSGLSAPEEPVVNAASTHPDQP
jgi:sulfate transport system ATP-binding protein